jgi:hypothetical protein
MICIEETLYQALVWVVFEPNDADRHQSASTPGILVCLNRHQFRVPIPRPKRPGNDTA